MHWFQEAQWVYSKRKLDMNISLPELKWTMLSPNLMAEEDDEIIVEEEEEFMVRTDGLN